MNPIIQALTSRKGQFSRAAWCRDCKVKKGTVHHIRKSTVKIVRAGIQYDNMQAVKAKRASGELPAENAGIPWANWIQYPYLLEHKQTRQQYVRLYPEKDSIYTEVQYFMDGVPVDFSRVEPFLLASEKGEENPDCIIVKLEDMIELY